MVTVRVVNCRRPVGRVGGVDDVEHEAVTLVALADVQAGESRHGQPRPAGACAIVRGSTGVVDHRPLPSSSETADPSCERIIMYDVRPGNRPTATPSGRTTSRTDRSTSKPGENGATITPPAGSARPTRTAPCGRRR
ncbi:hypothetical protein ACFQYP_05890 [Nonomuraea antimicrobica]